MDMRGHGLSDKPRDAYGDSRLWADDVRAVIHALDLDRPVLSGWSYGSLVFLDYIRHYGEDQIGGIHFVGGVTKLGSDAAMAVIKPAFLNFVPGLFATDAEESVRTSESFLQTCFNQSLSASDLYLMLGYNVSVPPHVRQAMLSRVIDNDDLLPRIRKPALITQASNRCLSAGRRSGISSKPASLTREITRAQHRPHTVLGGRHGVQSAPARVC